MLLSVLRMLRSRSSNWLLAIFVMLLGAVSGHFFGFFPFLGELVLNSPLITIENIIGIMAASYTVAAHIGVPQQLVTFFGGVLVLFFFYKLVFRAYREVLQRRKT